MADASISTQEQQLCEFLSDAPHQFKNRYTPLASNALLYSLFWSLAGGSPEYMSLLFPADKLPDPHQKSILSKAQGAQDGAEYTEGARGKPCGHIFKSGEATYRCKTCSTDDTCVLCAKCFASSDHTNHVIMITISPGNSGCCDCGDPEAWRIPVNCTIHTELEEEGKQKGKQKEHTSNVPGELEGSIRMTVARALDYLCDVISCSPEHLRQKKEVATVEADAKNSRLKSAYYPSESDEEPIEYAVILWNDEKHTVQEVQAQVSRACKVTSKEAELRAYETDDIGRSIVKYGTDLEQLLKVAAIIEQIKVTVSVRSARDTFREQMCGTIIEWLSDISGCAVGDDHDILRRIVCEEMLTAWRQGSEAVNAEVGKGGIDDLAKSEYEGDPDQMMFRRNQAFIRRQTERALRRRNEMMRRQEAGEDMNALIADEEEDDRESDVDEDPEQTDDSDDGEGLQEILDVILVDMTEGTGGADDQMDVDGGVDLRQGQDWTEYVARENSPGELGEAEVAGFPPPPPPPPPPLRRIQTDEGQRAQSPMEDAEMAGYEPSAYAKANMDIPKTPGKRAQRLQAFERKAPKYWKDVPEDFLHLDGDPPAHENLFKRVRLDYLILFDLRLWKQARIDLRDLYISTVVTIPEFKRILGLRFAGLYTLLAQLYLIADREPDHSIINISVQMLTTPSITAEIVEKGNFFTHLLSILFTFLTTRQVSPPYEINPNATLKIETGSVTNRRMYHFFHDLKYLFASPHMQQRLRTEERYLLQFLDLVKIHQGICPNIRAIGEHVEYETDAWISASLVTREINRLCRQFSESFVYKTTDDLQPLADAIRTTAKAVIVNSLGMERKRFESAEIKEELKFKRDGGDYEFDIHNTSVKKDHKIVKFDLFKEPISFHHALHYTLSWLIECGRSMSKKELMHILKFDDQIEILTKPRMMGHRILPSHKYDWEDYLMAAFDYPLRVCAWLSQMKAGLWVRNGMSLRHQASTYRSVSQRDVAYHRDIFLLQTAMVLVNPDRMLASMIDRYGLSHWMKGLYEQNVGSGFDHPQQLDIAEEMIHLLVILLCERTSLLTIEDEPSPHAAAMRRDIIHCLCFKPLSYTEICSRLGDKYDDHDECADILEEMTEFKPPVGVSDTGTFKLKEEYLADLDPYIAHYNKNQREEAENIAKAWVAKKTGRPVGDIVFEPKLKPIESGIFTDLPAFTNTGMFAQIIYYSLLYPIKAKDLTPNVQPTRVEAFLHVVLHLILVAITHDNTSEADSEEVSSHSFVHMALTKSARSNFIPEYKAKSIVALLNLMSTDEALESCQPKVKLILKRLRQKRQQTFDTAFARLGASIDRIDTASPAIANPDEERSRKRKAALERQAKIKADFQERQKSFAAAMKADIDWDDDELDEDMVEVDETKKKWKYPTGNCMYCQEETNESRPYGTFAMIGESHILRQTDFHDKDFVREAAAVPLDLDRSAEDIRPFGVAGENKKIVQKVNTEGYTVLSEESFIGKGFPSSMTKPGPVSTGCGHLMHYSCFDVYNQATHRTQRSQVARHHAERLDLNEFICPLCKAQGNAFLPIIWHDVEEQYPGVVEPRAPIDGWLDTSVDEALRTFRDQTATEDANAARAMVFFGKYLENRLVSPLLNELEALNEEDWQKARDSAHAPAYDPTIDMQLLAGGPQGAQQLIEIIATDRASVPVNNDSSSVQLMKIMNRIATTLELNGFGNYFMDPYSKKAPGRDGMDAMAYMVGLSIAAVEIQHRGVDSEGGSTFLARVPELSLTHLRVLCETVATSMALHCVQKDGKNELAASATNFCNKQIFQFFCHPITGEIKTAEPFLARDAFSWLAESTFYMVPFLDLDVMHVARLCYTAEIYKVLLSIVLNTSSSRLSSWYADEVESGSNDTSFQRALMFAMKANHDKASITDDMEPGAFKTDPITCGMDQDQFSNFESAKELAKRYALVFVRKLALLLHVQYGVDFNSLFPQGANELERLSHTMKLPSLEEICDDIGKGIPAIPSHGFTLGQEVDGGVDSLFSSLSSTQVLLWKWSALQRAWESDPNPQDGTLNAARAMTVSHPVIFELIGLPKNYDTLVEASVKAKCPTTGKDVSDPNLCLFCAAIVCGQATCCLKKEENVPRGQVRAMIGGAQQHMRE